MDDISELLVRSDEPYEPPEVSLVAEFGDATKGSYSRPHADDSDAGGYWSP